VCWLYRQRQLHVLFDKAGAHAARWVCSQCLCAAVFVMALEEEVAAVRFWQGFGSFGAAARGVAVLWHVVCSGFGVWACSFLVAWVHLPQMVLCWRCCWFVQHAWPLVLVLEF
jgi:hypothetical protein